MMLASKAMRAARTLPRILGFAGRSGGLILLYHRVTTLAIDSQRLAVAPEHFADHLEILARSWRPMMLSELVAGARDKTLPGRAVAVTLDDGYADNAEHAVPLLERFGIPATLFVTTSQVGGEDEFWWDELERLLLTPGVLPETLELRIGKSSCSWHLGPDRAYTVDDVRRHQGWNIECRFDPTRRHRIYRELHLRLRRLPHEDRTDALLQLWNAAADTRRPRETHRPIGHDDLQRLARGGLIEIGAHTVTHSRLAGLPLATQRREIRESRASLEAMTGSVVSRFAYPFGDRADYTLETVRLVREAGFAGACSVSGGLVDWRSDPFKLPRALVRNWDADAFADRLETWTGVRANDRETPMARAGT